MSIEELSANLKGRINAKEFRHGLNYWENAIMEADLSKILDEFFAEVGKTFVVVPRKQLEEVRQHITNYSLHYDELENEYMRTDSRIQDENTLLVLLDDVLQIFDETFSEKRLKELLEASK
jgi:hypothetical protein